MDVLWSLLAGVGGVVGALLLVFRSLGRIVERSVVKGVDAGYQRQLEHEKAALAVDTERANAYYALQLGLYRDLSAALYELTIPMETLWRRATRRDVLALATQLDKTLKAFQLNRLLIEPSHRAPLKALLDECSNFVVGKKRLIDIRDEPDVDLYAVDRVINENGDILNRYRELLARIDSSFDEHLHPAQRARGRAGGSMARGRR